MAVYFKFKSAKDFDTVSIDGHFISVANLKDKIVEQKKLGRGSDIDLVISNAQTNEEYTDEGFLVPKNTSVIVRRVPGRPSMPIVADVKDERKSSVEVPPVNIGSEILESTLKSNLRFLAPDVLDDFGIDLYAVPEVVEAPTTSLTEDEDNKIRAFVDASANEWQRQTQETFAAGKGYANKGQGRGLPLRGGAYGRGYEKKNPPHGYVCHRCGVTGHYIQHCPTNGDPTYDMKKVKPPTGIPKTMLVANPDGSYALPTGEVAVLKPNEAVFDREVDGLPSSSRAIFDIPPELCCPLCQGVLKEAVLTSKCCFKSYCDKCIRNEIILNTKCVCGATNILADDLLPNRTLRDAITRFLESQVSAATSSGNIGSRSQLPDMESAPYARPKVLSPAVSASLKEASSARVDSDGSDTNRDLAGGEDDMPKLASATARQGLKTKSVSGIGPKIEAGALDPVKQAMEVIDGSPESQLTKESAQEFVRLEKPVRSDTELRDQGPALSEPVKGKKKPKGKRGRQVDSAYSEGLWNQGPNYNNSHIQAENCCMHCGSYEHPSWNCYIMNGPGPSHPPPMQGPMFGSGFNPTMMGMMHHPVGERYMMPYHQNPGLYNGYGPPPYEFQFNGLMVPPHEPFVPHTRMIPYGPPPPVPRDYVDSPPMSREEFEAKKAEMKRRREREQRFGRKHLTTRLHGRVGPRVVSPSETQYELSLDLSDKQEAKARSDQNGEQHPARTRLSRGREDQLDEEEPRASSDGEGSQRDYHLGKFRDRWSSRGDEEASSGEEVSREGRYSRGQPVCSKQKGRDYAAKTNGSSAQCGLRSGQRRPASGYNSEDDGELRQSGSKVGFNSPHRAVRRTILDEQPSKEVEDIAKDSRGTRRLSGEKSVKATKGRPRGSVFDRTNLHVKPRRTTDNEYDVGDDQHFGARRSKGGSQGPDRREQLSRGSEDSYWHISGIASKKRRVKQDS